ncbi:MAG: hypothetical protein GY804_13155 [Alphaproteobacteria bacterium]|nr:hypothetical protein [Alphaproteobacteria bacterium]
MSKNDIIYIIEKTIIDDWKPKMQKAIKKPTTNPKLKIFGNVVVKLAAGLYWGQNWAFSPAIDLVVDAYKKSTDGHNKDDRTRVEQKLEEEAKQNFNERNSNHAPTSGEKFEQNAIKKLPLKDKLVIETTDRKKRKEEKQAAKKKEKEKIKPKMSSHPFILPVVAGIAACTVTGNGYHEVAGLALIAIKTILDTKKSVASAMEPTDTAAEENSKKATPPISPTGEITHKPSGLTYVKASFTSLIESGIGFAAYQAAARSRPDILDILKEAGKHI